MPDNVPITAGSGTNIAADELTYSGDTTKLQLVRPVFVTGAEGSKSVVEIADSDGALRVRPRANQKRSVVQSAGLTTATTAYTAGDQVGNIFAFPNAVAANGGFGVINHVELINAGDIIGTYDVVILRDTATLAADNAAFSLSVADILKVVTIIPLDGAYDLGAARVAYAGDIARPFDCVATTLYAALITRSGHTFFGAAGDLHLVLHTTQA